MKKATLIFLFFAVILLASCAKEETKIVKKEIKKADIPKLTPEEAKAEITGILKDRISDYKASYEISAPDSPVSKITLAYKGNKSRIDTSWVSGNQKITNSVFILEDGAYICSETPRLACIQTDPEEAAETSFTSEEEIQKNLESFSVEKLPSKTIAGVKAECYRLISAEATSDVCYSRQGILLYVKTTQSEMTATDYSTNVPESLFVLPAEPQSYETYQAGIAPT